MKKLLIIAASAAILSFSSYAAQAQEKEKQDTASTSYKVKKGARKAGDKTSELGAKGVAEVKDKTYADKVGPDGQTIYIDKHSKYYWINKKGDKVYVTKLELKDKPQD